MATDTCTAHVNVFLADDSPAIRQRLASLLDAAEMQVVGEGATPESCIRGILDARPDVVVLDVQLEGGTGLQVLRTVREVDPRVAFVVFTNNSAPAYRKKYLKEGAALFLDKSSDFEQLAGALATACGRTLH